MSAQATGRVELQRASFWQALAGATVRNNLRLSRNAASIVSAFVIPGLFMVSFWAVFGHAASTSGFDYALFLMAACLFQAVMFTAGGSALAIGVDAESGLLGRIKAMPVNPLISIGGRLATDLIRSVCSLIAVMGLGLLCGAKPHSWGGMALAFVVALIMGNVLGLFFLGVTLRSSHSVQVANLLQGVEMPLLMLSTAFIPVETLPEWLGPIIKHLPFSPLIDTTRAFLTGSSPGSTGWEAMAWLVVGFVLGTWWVSRALRRQA